MPGRSETWERAPQCACGMDTIRSSRVRAGSPPTAVSIVAVSGAPPTSRASYRLLTVRACSWELEKKKSVINGGNGACHMGQMGCETRLKLHGELPCGEARFGDDDEATDAHVEPVDGEREGKCRRRINPPLRGARWGGQNCREGVFKRSVLGDSIPFRVDACWLEDDGEVIVLVDGA